MDNQESGANSSAKTKSDSKLLIIIVAIVVLLLVGAGGWYFMGSQNAKQASEMASKQEEQPTPTSAPSFTSIQDALSKSLSLRCEYTDDSGKKAMTYIKNGAMRTDISGTTVKESTSTIMKDKKLYVWSGAVGTVIAFDIDAMSISVTPTERTGVAGAAQKVGNVIAGVDKFRNSCQAGVVDDALFTPPADVKFTDMSAVMNKMQAMPSSVKEMTKEKLDAIKEKVQQ